MTTFRVITMMIGLVTAATQAVMGTNWLCSGKIGPACFSLTFFFVGLITAASAVMSQTEEDEINKAKTLARKSKRIRSLVAR